MIFITTCILILAYTILGKNTGSLMKHIKNINWRCKINGLIDNLRPWALKAGRVATRPLLQFYYVMYDNKTTILERILIYGAIIYTIMPIDFVPRVVYRFIGVLDDGIAILYVYKKIKDKITPEIDRKVNDTLNEWFCVEYEIIKG